MDREKAVLEGATPVVAPAEKTVEVPAKLRAERPLYVSNEILSLRVRKAVAAIGPRLDYDLFVKLTAAVDRHLEFANKESLRALSEACIACSPTDPEMPLAQAMLCILSAVDFTACAARMTVLAEKNLGDAVAAIGKIQ